METLAMNPVWSTVLVAVVGLLSATHPALAALLRGLGRTVGIGSKAGSQPPSTPGSIPLLSTLWPAIAKALNLPTGTMASSMPPAAIAALAAELREIAVKQSTARQQDAQLLAQLSGIPAVK